MNDDVFMMILKIWFIKVVTKQKQSQNEKNNLKTLTNIEEKFFLQL